MPYKNPSREDFENYRSTLKVMQNHADHHNFGVISHLLDMALAEIDLAEREALSAADVRSNMSGLKGH